VIDARRIIVAAATLALAALPPRAAAAQDLVLRGLVLDERGAPAAGVPVALHRIAETGGALVEEATSDADGRFALHVGEPATSEAIFFVVARYHDELYIGPTFRPPFPADAEYVMHVGVEEASASAITRGAGQVAVAPPASPWRYALLGLLAVAFVAVAGTALARASGPPARRRLLIRIARLDEDIAAADGTAPADSLAERNRLLERLRSVG
jgi:hypothetical protein